MGNKFRVNKSYTKHVMIAIQEFFFFNEKEQLTKDSLWNKMKNKL